MRPLVSVIVPVYKVEKYLVRCLDSLCNQSLSDIEILLIDDASPDRCDEICELYAKKDLRFRVFHSQINHGLSVARNNGIANAHGDYLMFVDSDDWVHEDFCKDAYECAMRYKADLVMFRHQRNEESTQYKNVQNNMYNSMPSGYKTRLEAIDLLWTNVGPAAWSKLYHKKLFKNISFPPGYVYEDIGTTYKIVLQASCIYYLNKVLYYKFCHIGSITTTKTEKAMHDWVVMLMQQYRDLAEWGYPIAKLDAWLKSTALYFCMKDYSSDSNARYAFCSKVLLSSKSIPGHFTWKSKVLFVLFKYFRPLFDLVCYIYGTKVC